MQTETQRNFKEQMKQLEKSGKIEKKRPKYTVRFSEHKTLTGIISSFVEVSNNINLREETLINQLISRANLDTPFSTAEIDGMQGEIDKLQESLLQVKGAETNVQIETQQLDQLQVILDNMKSMPLQSEQINTINLAIESYNQLNQEAKNALIKYLTNNHIQWHYNDDGSISYEY